MKLMGQYEKVLEVLLKGNGQPVTLEEIKSECEIAGINMSRLSTYIWEIKTKTKYAVVPVKDGRKVTAYRLID